MPLIELAVARDQTTPGTWEKDAFVEHQWLRDGKPITPDGGSNFLILTSADVGKKISVQAIGRHMFNHGYALNTVTSDPVTVTAKPKPAPEPAPVPQKKFKDVPSGMQFAQEIQWMSDMGISTGWADNTFRPQGLVARDAMSAFMYRLSNSPAFTAPEASPFKDIAKGQQFYKEMSWLASTKVSTGWSDKTYRPLAPVNRDAMAAFLYRLAGSPKFTPPKVSRFTDVPVNSQFYKEISWLYAKDISTGWFTSNGTMVFKPQESVKRDAMAAFMSRYYYLGDNVYRSE